MFTTYFVQAIIVVAPPAIFEWLCHALKICS